jgi:hypothetical protein
MRYIYKPVFQHLSTTDKILCVLYWKEGTYLSSKEISRYVPKVQHIGMFVRYLAREGWLERVADMKRPYKPYLYKLVKEKLRPRKIATLLSTVREREVLYGTTTSTSTD